MPISLSLIRQKLEKYKYRTFAALETDFEVLVSNSTNYHPKDSTEYKHALELKRILEKYKLENRWTSNDIKMAQAALEKYSGLSFQQAQEKIIEDTITYQENPKYVNILQYGHIAANAY